MLTKLTLSRRDHLASNGRRVLMRTMGRLWESGIGYPWYFLEGVDSVNRLGEQLETLRNSLLISTNDNQS